MTRKRKPTALLAGLLLACQAMAAAAQSIPLERAASTPLARATTATDPALSSASAEVQRVAHWVLASGDNTRLPFLLVDKVNAQVFVFDGTGKLRGTAPALLGMAHGDRLLVPNDTKVQAVPPEARITPAGRYVSRLAIDEHGGELLAIDYDASISLHPVVKGTPEEHRAERLGSPTSEDNRISYGCINVPKDFYADVVSPTFTGTYGVVYILPETESATALFRMQPIIRQVGAAGSNQQARAAK